MAAKAIALGDRLLGADASGARLTSVRVVSLGRAQDDLRRIEVAGGGLLCSATHPLMVREASGLVEVAASALTPGTRLLLADLSETTVLAVSDAGRGPVVKIGTDGDRLYFAGEPALLGHNYKIDYPVEKDGETGRGGFA